MGPKRGMAAGKRKKEMLKVRKGIVRKREGGMRSADLAKEYRRRASAIAAILKMKVKRRTPGLEVSEEEEEDVEGHDQERTTEDLVEPQKDAMEEEEEEERRREEHLSTRELEELCQMWGNVQTLVQQHHPDKALVQRSIRSFDTDIMSYFRGMLKRRQRQQWKGSC